MPEGSTILFHLPSVACPPVPIKIQISATKTLVDAKVSIYHEPQNIPIWGDFHKYKSRALGARTCWRDQTMQRSIIGTTGPSCLEKEKLSQNRHIDCVCHCTKMTQSTPKAWVGFIYFDILCTSLYKQKQCRGGSGTFQAGAHPPTWHLRGSKHLARTG